MTQDTKTPAPKFSCLLDEDSWVRVEPDLIWKYSKLPKSCIRIDTRDETHNCEVFLSIAQAKELIHQLQVAVDSFKC